MQRKQLVPVLFVPLGVTVKRAGILDVFLGICSNKKNQLNR